MARWRCCNETFQLVPAPLAFDQPLPSEPVRGIYRSVSEPDLVVVDKENGGCKADAANAGINAASGVLVLVIDADTVLEADALEPRRAAVPRRPGDGGGRRQCRDRQRLSHRARPHRRRRAAAQLARAVPGRRVHARVPAVPARVRVAECRRAHLGCIRPVPPRCGDRRRRLRPDRDRRGHGSHHPPAAALPRARRAGPDRVRPQPPLLDAGARGLGGRCGHSVTAGAGDCSRRSGDIAG